MKPHVNQTLKTQIIEKLTIKSTNKSSSKLKINLMNSLNQNAWVTSQKVFI